MTASWLLITPTLDRFLFELNIENIWHSINTSFTQTLKIYLAKEYLCFIPFTYLDLRVNMSRQCLNLRLLLSSSIPIQIISASLTEFSLRFFQSSPIKKRLYRPYPNCVNKRTLRNLIDGLHEPKKGSFHTLMFHISSLAKYCFFLGF